MIAFYVSLTVLTIQSNVVLSKTTWVDMSYGYKNHMIVWGSMMPYQIDVVVKGPKGKIPFVFTNEFRLNEHVGTHIDAPAHITDGKWTVDEIPIENLIAPAIVVNISEKAAKDRNAQMTVSDLQQWEKTNGRIPDGCVLLMFTDWGKYWGNFTAYMGAKRYNDTYSDPKTYRFPGIHKDAAQWLVDNRKLNGIGVDVRSLDYGKSDDASTHRVLLSGELFGLESVANIDNIPTKGATLFIMPMKIMGGSGGPTRILARIDDGNDTPNAAIGFKSMINITFIACFAFLTLLF